MWKCVLLHHRKRRHWFLTSNDASTYSEISPRKAVHFTGEMNSFELETDRVDALFRRREVDLTQAVVEVTDLTRVHLSTR